MDKGNDRGGLRGLLHTIAGCMLISGDGDGDGVEKGVGKEELDNDSNNTCGNTEEPWLDYRWLEAIQSHYPFDREK